MLCIFVFELLRTCCCHTHQKFQHDLFKLFEKMFNVFPKISRRIYVPFITSKRQMVVGWVRKIFHFSQAKRIIYKQNNPLKMSSKTVVILKVYDDVIKKCYKATIAQGCRNLSHCKIVQITLNVNFYNILLAKGLLCSCMLLCLIKYVVR
jgi:predicted peroxiredoxin